MRDIGYGFESAVADIIDNSITAGARHICIRAGWSEDAPYLAILDDGSGMNQAELVEAMRPGTRSPLETRAKDDLGRFGLGLKTASFSQCRRLTVLSRKSAETSARCWDLDIVGRFDKWVCFPPSRAELEFLPCAAELIEQGTLVVWEKLDRLDLGQPAGEAQTNYNRRLASLRDHIALVFHRYLEKGPGRKPLTISINNCPIEPFDPFNSSNPTTIYHSPETFKVCAQPVTLQAFILPHHSKVKAPEYERLAGPEGYLRNQGFYVYRNKRLIIHGTWFRMAKQEELTKLARVMVDIPNTLDHLWTIDVRKSRAHPPQAVKTRMKALVDRIRESAKRPYTYRGTVVANSRAAPVWRRVVSNTGIAYEVDKSHPLITSFLGNLEERQRDEFLLLLKMIGLTFPTALLFSDIAGSPEKVEQKEEPATLLADLAELLAEGFVGADESDFVAHLGATEPFASFPDWVKSKAPGLYKRRIAK